MSMHYVHVQPTVSKHWKKLKSCDSEKGKAALLNSSVESTDEFNNAAKITH